MSDARPSTNLPKKSEKKTGGTTRKILGVPKKNFCWYPKKNSGGTKKKIWGTQKNFLGVKKKIWGNPKKISGGTKKKSGGTQKKFWGYPKKKVNICIMTKKIGGGGELLKNT